MSNLRSFVAALGDTILIPSHEDGDLLVVSAWNVGTSSVALPSGWTSIYQQSGVAISTRNAYRLSDGTLDAVTLANAQAVGLWIFGSPDASPIGGQNSNGAASRSAFSFSAFTPLDVDGSSWRLGGGASVGTGLAVSNSSALVQRSLLEDDSNTFYWCDQAGITEAPLVADAIAPSASRINRASNWEVRLIPVSPAAARFRHYFTRG